MFGAKGDGVTDDTQAFEDAIASGKNVVCKHRATYFFNGNTIIDASAVNHCYLDLNESKLVNFHIKVGIKDGYKSGTGTAMPGFMNTVTIKNGSIGGVDWNTKMVNWETPIIQVGINVCLEKLSIENAPYLMATVSAYRDVFIFKNILKTGNSALWTSDALTLDAINVIKKDGTFARFNDADITAAISTGSGGGVAGDGWIFEGVGEWRGRENDDYAFIRFYRNQPIIIRNCVQSKFIVAKYSKASFIGCHFENPYTMPEIYNLTDATTKSLAGMAGSTQILFDTCYFYNNYVLETDYENVTYMNCYFRKAGDSTDGDKNIPLADTLKNRDYYDMKCKIINSSLANYRNVDTDRFNLWKRLPKKTYNKRRKTHDSLTKIPATAADIASGSNIFPETGAYTYKTITFSNGADIANEEREWVRNITSLNSAVVSTGNMNAFNGGWRIEQYRTLPSGAIQRARFYLDPDNLDYQEGKDIFCYWALNDLGTYASLKFGILHTSSTYTEVYYVLPWITVDEIPTYTVNDKIYEQNGVLNSEDFSEVLVDGDLPYFNGSRVFQKFSTLPTANATNLGRILMYTGETTSTLTHGYIYECVLNGLTYKWVQRDVQPSGGSGGGIPSGGTTGQVLVKKSNTDYDAEWADGGSEGTLVEHHATYTEPFTSNATYPPTITVISDTKVNVVCDTRAYEGATFTVSVLPNKINAITVRFENISGMTKNAVGILFKPTRKATSYGNITISQDRTSFDKTFYMAWDDIKNYVTDGNLLKVTVYTADAITSDISVDAHYLKGQGALHGKTVTFFGDSITTETYDWTRLFTLITESEKIQNIAVVGATLYDFNDTVHDGNPQSSVPHNNTLSNQVQKAINNQYDAPDIVVVAIGANGGIYATQSDIDEAYSANFAELDLTKSAHAFRYCTEKIRALYPNAKIIWCNPIQGANLSPQVVVGWANNLRTLTAYGAVYNVETNRCGINQSEEADSHVYLLDGLHPNFNGSMLMAKYNSVAISTLFE